MKAVESNKEIMLRFVEFINTADKKLAEEIISPDAVFHVPNSPEPMRGVDGYMAIIGMMRGGFTDIQWTLKDLIIENDKVAARFIMQGTHDGLFFRVPSTGNSINVQAINFYTLLNGKIIEEYGQPDQLGLMQQIGAIPAP